MSKGHRRGGKAVQEHHNRTRTLIDGNVQPWPSRQTEKLSPPHGFSIAHSLSSEGMSAGEAPYI